MGLFTPRSSGCPRGDASFHQFSSGNSFIIKYGTVECKDDLIIAEVKHLRDIMLEATPCVPRKECSSSHAPQHLCACFQFLSSLGCATGFGVTDGHC